MNIKIFTFPFESQTGSFPDKSFQNFCSTHTTQILSAAFFSFEGIPYWTICVSFRDRIPKKELVSFDTVCKKHLPPVSLTEIQEKQLSVLKDWRRKVALEAGVPIYIICTNQQLVSIVCRQCRTLKDLDSVKGIGQKKIQMYGQEILRILSSWEEVFS